MSAGTWQNIHIAYAAEAEHLRGKPLLSAPRFTYPMSGRNLTVEFLRPRRPKKHRGQAHHPFGARVKIGATTFGLVYLTPKRGEPYIDAMMIDAGKSFQIDAGSDEALFFLRIDYAVRTGEDRALGLLALIEWGLAVQKFAARMAAQASPAPGE